MKKNIGELDGVIRVIISFILAYSYYITEVPSNLQIAGLLVACYLIITATFGNDVFYRLFKCSTFNTSGKTNCKTCEPCDACSKCNNCEGCEC